MSQDTPDDVPPPPDREVPAAEVVAHETSLPDPHRQDLEPDVERLHRAIYREPRDPIEGREPAPWWVWAAAALTLFWGGWYLGHYGGPFGIATGAALPSPLSDVRREEAQRGSTAQANPVEAGRRVYTARCQSCHQPDGRGIPGTFPPLAGSEWVVGSPVIVGAIILNGLHGPVTAAGQTVNGVMPTWRDLLIDSEIAAVATFIRQLRPNAAPPVAPDLIAKLRAATRQRTGPWTADSLRAAAPQLEAAVAGPAPSTTTGTRP
jgi:mono/diheme cytochrome c family protein